MLFPACQTSSTHSFVPQHVLNTSFLVYKTPHNMTQCILSMTFLSCKTLQHAIPTVTRCDHTVSWRWKRPKDALSSKNVSQLVISPCNMSEYVVFSLQSALNMWFFSCKTSSECTFLAQRALNMLFLVCEMLHYMKFQEYVSQHVVSFRQSVSNM